jgi:hypothetical protein
MVRLPVFDPIEFLVDRKFGASLSSGGITVWMSAERRAQTNPRLARQISDYQEQLRQLLPDDIKALVKEEQERQKAEMKEKNEREERERFFNQPHAQADFDHWSRAAHWTLDEAVALSFGKAPERVNWEKVKPFVQVSEFAFQYQRRRDLALRARAWEQLFDPVLPGIFVAWAKRTDIPVPPELEAALTARGTQIADWKTHYDNLSAKFDEHHQSWLEICEKKDGQIRHLLQQREELQNRLDSAATPALSATPEISLGTRERESLLKLVIGMAVGGYGYDSAAARSEHPAEIANDLATSGVALDVDTVRKWLKQAAELLPPKQTE